jgi:membrane protein YqaA with SNARE-associated domain
MKLNLLLRPRRWIESLCKNAERAAQHRWAVPAVLGLELIGCTVVPLPVALLLVAFVTAAPKKWVRFALSATGGSMIGGVVLYFVGRAFFGSVGQSLIHFYGTEERWSNVVSWFNSDWGLTFVVLGGMTTGLFRAVSLAAGLTAMNPLLFLGLLSFSRLIRFLAECGAIRYVGDRARSIPAGYFKYVTAGAAVIIVAALILVSLSA